MIPALLTELKRLGKDATPDEDGLVLGSAHRALEDAYVQHCPALIEAVETMHAALEEVAAHKGMTNLGECCVDKTCTPAFEDGQKVAYCQFAHGVNRGFNTCAHEASDALARVAGLLGEGREK